MGGAQGISACQCCCVNSPTRGLTAASSHLRTQVVAATDDVYVMLCVGMPMASIAVLVKSNQ